MNFLAHLYLSGEDENLCFGNFIADSLKGNTYKTYSLAVQKGVELHREIDTYTDQHPIFRQHCKLLFDQHRHYARVIMDVLYDHFLALHWNRFSSISLEQYAQKFYRMVDHRIDELPLAMHRLFHLMKSQNWLVSYSSE